MKKKLLLIGFILCFSLTTCRKNQEPVLPPETTIGAMSFGCKINGKVFVPKDGRGKPGLYVQYVYLDGGWYLNIPAVDWRSSYPILSVHIETDSLLIEEGEYEFKLEKGYPSAFYSAETFYILLENKGRLNIKKHDLTNRILAGTFYFTAENSKGERVEVTDGRFDIRY